MMTSNESRRLTLAVSLVAMLGLAGCASSDGDIDELSGGGGGQPPITQGSCQLNGTPLCAIPGAGPAIVSGAGGDCTAVPPDAGQLDGYQLCQVPGVGTPLAEAICGGTCPDAGGGGGAEPPLSLEELCAIPTLGPQIVEGAGGMCPPAGGGGGGGQCLPNQCDPTGNGCLSDIPGFGALVCP